jgi:UDP-N-acetylglucosamine--N-acetylmuramyl-(pentapeptide) pyrophosphoryl-undecaprenol N-acetylglucosamine transferase
MARGAADAWRFAARWRPEAVLVTGGYASVPVAIAARLRRVPVVVFLPDVLPGRAVQIIARLATRIAASTIESEAHLPKSKTTVTGYPVRRAVRAAARSAARQSLELDPAAPVVLIFGGSRGARSINRAVYGSAERLLSRTEIVHVTGAAGLADAERARAALPEALRAKYHVHAFLDDDEMASALASSDLAVSRAGASILGEYPARGLPAVLVPLPIAGGHQWANAAVLTEAGAARAVTDGDLNPELLLSVVSDLLDAPDQLSAMRRAALSLDRPDAPLRIWRLVVDAASAGPAQGTLSA